MADPRRRNSKMQKQAVFWEKLKNKYEERNASLEEQESELTQRLEMMEAKYGQNQQRASQEMSPQGGNCPCKPCPWLKSSAPYETRQQGSFNGEPRSSSPGRTNNDSSVFSIQSNDLVFMKTIQELKEREKLMQAKICEMKEKEKVYLNTLQQADQTWAKMEGDYEKRLSVAQESESAIRAQYEQQIANLMDKNMKLTEELCAVKFELKQCKEKGDGSLVRQLEEEKRRSKQLEANLEIVAKSATSQIEDEKRKSQQLKENLENLSRRSKQLEDNLEVISQSAKSQIEEEKRKSKQLEENLEIISQSAKSQIEEERRKSQQLAENLEIVSQNANQTECTYVQEVDVLKRQLDNACKNIDVLSDHNGQLQQNVEVLQNQCKGVCNSRAKYNV